MRQHSLKALILVIIENVEKSKHREFIRDKISKQRERERKWKKCNEKQMRKLEWESVASENSDGISSLKFCA